MSKPSTWAPLNLNVTEGPCAEGRCMCPTCGEFFSIDDNFDRHRKREYGVNRHCVDPASVGLVIKPVKGGTVWAGKPPKSHVLYRVEGVSRET